MRRLSVRRRRLDRVAIDFYQDELRGIGRILEDVKARDARFLR
jgi:hypothetical protein